MPSYLDLFEQRLGFALPQAVVELFRTCGGTEMPSRSVKLLPMSEAKRLLENWPRYGFSSDRKYVPFAEDKNGDLFCVACADDCRGQVFHLAWAGEEEFRFATLEEFIKQQAAGG